MMSYSNRELVEFFVNHKLKISSTVLLSPDALAGRNECNGQLVNSRKGGGKPSPIPGDIEAVKVALQDSAEKFEQLFLQVFSDLSSQIEINTDTAYNCFKCVMDELFKDGVNWGRIVGLFVFGGVVCAKCVERGMSELVPRIIDWMTIYLDEQLSPWIQSEGGWDSFVRLFRSDPDAAARTEAQKLLATWLFVGVTLLTGVVLGLLFLRKQ